MVRVFAILTSYKEEKTIGKAVEKIIVQDQWQSDVFWGSFHLVVVAPDEQTLKKAREVCLSLDYKNYSLLKDNAQGKAIAMNIAVDHLKSQFKLKVWEDFLIFTDGDMYVADDAIKNLLKPFQNTRFSHLVGVSGRVVSLDERTNQFGYYSHLFCQAAHLKRLKSWQKLIGESEKHQRRQVKNSNNNNSDNSYAGYFGFERFTNLIPITKSQHFVPMSGYLYAIRFVDGIFPLPAETRAEDAYISKKLADLGYLIGYAPDALAYVKFPKNLSDWVKQKSRSLGGNVQISKFFGHKYNARRRNGRGLIFGIRRPDLKNPFANSARSIFQDLSMFFFPLFFAKNPKEFIWSLMLYPLRLFLWIKIYYNHLLNSYKKGSWERIESTK